MARNCVKFAELVDVKKLQSLMDSIHSVLGVACAIIELDGEAITRSGWQNVCLKYHLAHPETRSLCVECETLLANSLVAGKQYVAHDCLNGLVDAAAPIFVDGNHVANVFTGQFFTAPPDLDFFRARAREFGFDEEGYLAAVNAAPVLDRGEIAPMMQFIARIAELLAANGLEQLRARQAEEALSGLNQSLDSKVAERTAELTRRNEELSQSEAHLKALLDNLPSRAWLKDENCNYIACNRAFAEAVGLDDPMKIAGKTDFDFWPQQIAQRYQREDREVMKSRKRILSEEESVGKNGVRGWYETSKIAILGANGEVLGTAGFARDITESRTAADLLQSVSHYTRSLIEASPDPLVTISSDGKITDVNRATETVTGLSREILVGTDFSDYFIEPEKAREGYRQVFSMGHVTDYPLVIRRTDGKLTDVLYNASLYRDERGKVLGVFAAARDVTERNRLIEELKKQARMDMLTGLYNRRYFLEQAEQEILRTSRYHGPLSLLMLDIDRFKRINDSRGHQAGDHVLRKFGEICREILREVDIMGRMGGEEFAVLLPQTDSVQALEVAERLRLAFAQARVDKPPIHFTVSIGAATRDDGLGLDAFLNRADEALYAAKNAGRNQVKLWQP